MLILARADEPERFRGQVVLLTDDAPLAPTLDTTRYRRLGSLLPHVFASVYRDELARLWRDAPGLFTTLIDAARTGDVTFADEWPDNVHAPRRILADVLIKIRRGTMVPAPPGDDEEAGRVVANSGDLRRR